MKRKLTAFLLCLMMIPCLFMTPIRASNNSFLDISTDSYYYDSVIWALENGVTTGATATTFEPNATCTRGQVVTFLWRSQGEPEPTSSKNMFTDVATSSYYFKPVLWAVEQGITNGTSTTTFSPSATCTNAQVLTFLWRAVDEPSANGKSSLAAQYSGKYFESAIAWADMNGMLSDMGSKAFSATANCPRSDIVTYLYRFAKNSTKQTQAQTTYVQLTPTSYTSFSYSDVPAYSGSAFVKINNNNPYFSYSNLTTDSYEMYGNLDALGRCTTCVACVGTDIMPTAERGSIGQVKPTGWHTVKYDCVEGKYLYNRSHLIGYQLTGENANTKNLITGTRYFNMNMLDYENLIAEYVEDYDAHVLYRVTPVFEGYDLVAKGVLMEGMSVEDQGKSVKFCVFMYNVQPNITIDYSTGNSYETNATAPSDSQVTQTTQTAQTSNSTTTISNSTVYITESGTKYHNDGCSYLSKSKIAISLSEAKIKGYTPCSRCW